MTKNLVGKSGPLGRYTMLWRLILTQQTLAISPTGEQGNARRDTLHNPEEAVAANATTACINLEMQGTSPFHAGQNSGILIRSCALDQ
jgi:hypothetical protein